jgi:GxxExxY protein
MRNKEKKMKDYTHEIIGAAIEVHRHLGLGLLESAYQTCLAHEMTLRGIAFKAQAALPVSYKGVELDCAYRMDYLVGDTTIVEIKSAQALTPINEAQLLTYLKLAGKQVGLLMNFNVPFMRDGIERLVLGYDG